jgi:predicted transcriptional regulator
MKTQTEATRAHYGAAPSAQFVRKVWAAVTRTPRASVKELAVAVGAPESSFGNVSAALRMLRDAGYIAFNNHAKLARRILVPFVVG